MFNLDRAFLFLGVVLMIVSAGTAGFVYGRRLGVVLGTKRGDRLARKRFRAQADEAMREVKSQVEKDQFHEFDDTNPAIITGSLPRMPRVDSTTFENPFPDEIRLELTPDPFHEKIDAKLVNDAFQEIAGMIKDELEPLTPSDLKHGDPIEFLSSPYQWEFGRVQTLALRAPDGTYVVSVRDVGGRIRNLPLWEVRRPK